MVWMDLLEHSSNASAKHWLGLVDNHAPKQRVRFHLRKFDDETDDDDTLSDDNSEESPLPADPPAYLDEECKSQLWWNQEECAKICDDAQKVSEFYSSERSDYTRGFLSVFSYLSQCDDDSEAVKELGLISQTSARGLEVYIFPILNRCRNKAVQDILKAQANIPPHLDADVKQRMLSAKSKFLSGPARKLAKVLGDGDAMVAMKIRGEEMGGKCKT